jgi:hypothetical protein
LQEAFSVLRDERTIFERWKTIIDKYEVKGKSTHDARLVAAMQWHQLTHILTFNVADFKRYSGIEILEPAAVGNPETT